ncbi:MAG: alpha-ribazole phosphatase [Vicingus serpentipes]|nr:alpha-ribazole phosphatase [Vicingus serpentipes]
MEIYLIRHTTPQIEKGICYGQTDILVSNSFKEECQIIGLKLREILNDTPIYCSPLSRCYGLAKELSNIQPIIDDRLMEMNFGDWELKPWHKIEKKSLNKWMKDFINVPCPNGESYQTLHCRVSEFIKELKQTKLEKVIIITHGGVIRSILSYIQQSPLEESFETEVNYSSIFKLKL